MADLKLADSSTKQMTNRDFQRLSNFIHSELGIKMPPSKKIMLESRLQKRLRHLNLSSYTDYCKFLFSSNGMNQELVHMIDVVTTNKTDFFREPAHFDYLKNVAIPDLLKKQKNVKIWSAGCSFGDEPYTLAMVLSEIVENYSNFRFSILATDISTNALQIAQKGIYRLEKVDPVPLGLKKKYLLKSKNHEQKLVRIVPELSQYIQFKRLNLMDKEFNIHGKMDIIFCRNVIIYFNKETQENLLNKYYRQLDYNGYLFLGHSETLNGLDVPFIQVAPTIYKKMN
jgi:chemotaxis protein methyltransferase CheR